MSVKPTAKSAAHPSFAFRDCLRGRPKTSSERRKRLKPSCPSLTWTAPTDPPERDELEISLFGPGFGECLVAHLGWGDWIIVDSCLSPDGKIPVGLAYLKRLGVDVRMAVRRVIATHWHNDHVRGLAQTLQECGDAKFICSQALFTKEFIALTNLWKGQQLTASPVSELTAIIDTIAKTNSV